MRNIVLISAAIFFLIACRKRDDTRLVFSLPEKTQSGKNTFGFVLNNEVWRNHGRFLFSSTENLSGRIFKSDGDIKIDASKIIFQRSTLVSYHRFGFNLVTGFKGTGTYSALANDTMSVSFNFNANTFADTVYILPSANPRTFNITITRFDTLFNILSGEFSGTLFRRLSPQNFTTSLTDSINIVDGRFDIKY